MLREGLAAEFPFAARALASVRRPRVAREDPRWAALSAFGAAWIVTSAGQVLATAIRVVGNRDPASWTSGAFSVVGAAIGIAVAARAGGRRGLAWYAVGLVLVAGITLATQLPGFLLFCERSGGLLTDCSLIRLALPHVYTLGGILLSVVAVRFLTGGAPGMNVVLNAAGASVLVNVLAFALWGATSFRPTDANAGLALGLGVPAAGMVAAGVVMRLRRARLRSLLVFGAIVMAFWLGQQGPFLWDFARGVFVVTGPNNLYGAFVGPAELAALVLGWLIPLRR